MNCASNRSTIGVPHTQQVGLGVCSREAAYRVLTFRSLEDLHVAVARELGRSFPAEVRQALEAEGSQLVPTLLVGDDSREDLEELVRAFGIEVFRGFVGDLREATGSRDDCGASCREGLQDG